MYQRHGRSGCTPDDWPRLVPGLPDGSESRAGTASAVAQPLITRPGDCRLAAVVHEAFTDWWIYRVRAIIGVRRSYPPPRAEGVNHGSALRIQPATAHTAPATVRRLRACPRRTSRAG